MFILGLEHGFGNIGSLLGILISYVADADSVRSGAAE